MTSISNNIDTQISTAGELSEQQLEHIAGGLIPEAVRTATTVLLDLAGYSTYLFVGRAPSGVGGAILTIDLQIASEYLNR